MKNFFEKSFPNDLKLLCLNYYNYSRVNMKFYINSLLPCLRRVTREVYLENFHMDQDELSMIIKACKNCERVIIRSSKINGFGTIDFGDDIIYSTKFISFEWTGHKDNSNWFSNFDQFDQIIQAIKDTDLYRSLETISLYQ